MGSAAIAFREWLGGEKAINDYCHKIAVEGAKKLVEVVGTRDIDISGEITLNMVRASPSPSSSLPIAADPLRMRGG